MENNISGLKTSIGALGLFFLFFKGNYALSPLENQSFVAFECLSSSDITIQYVKTGTANATIIQTIAECETDLQGCYLVEQSFGQHYAVFYTDRGAIFFINGISEKTRGTYRCCETYNSKACYSTHTWPMSGNSTTVKSEMGTNISLVEESIVTNKHSIVIVVFSVASTITTCVSIVLSVVVLCRRLKRKKLDGPTQSESKLLPLKFSENII